MKFDIREKINPNLKRYSKQDLEIAKEFAKKAYKEFGTFVKAIVLFGSAAKRRSHSGSDVDVLIVVNDLTITLSAEVVEAYRIVMERLVTETSKRIHLTTLRFTNFWDYVRNGDPIAINMLRDGVALIDTGFFDPLQALLYNGKIRPTYESIWTYYQRAPNTLWNSKWHILQATVDLYWAVIDSAHAALMALGEIPPSPNHIADMMETKMVTTGITAKKYATTMQKFFDISKKIGRRELKEVSGAEYDRYHTEAKQFVDEMKRIIDKESAR